MTFKVFVEGYAIKSERSWDGRTRVREWGWRILLAATGQIVAFNGGYKTKRAAVAVGRETAVGYYGYDEAEVIELIQKGDPAAR